MNRLVQIADKVPLILGIILFVLLVLWPFAIIWALNTIGNFGIPYSFWTWLAIEVLLGVWINGGISFRKKR